MISGSDTLHTGGSDTLSRLSEYRLMILYPHLTSLGLDWAHGIPVKSHAIPPFGIPRDLIL